MSFILIIITFFFVFLLIKNFSKGVILTTYTVFFLNYLSTGIPGVRLFYLLVAVMIPLFLYHVYIKRDIKLYEKYPPTILFASFFISGCYLITNFYAIEKQTVTIIVNLMCYFVYPYIFWHVVNTKEKLTNLLKGIIILFIIAVVYTFIEVALGNNPLTVFMLDNGFNEGLLFDREQVRMGFKRCNSIFEYVSTLGFLSASAFFMFFFLRYVYKFSDMKKWLKYLLCLLPVCIFFTGTRSQMLAFLVCFFPLLFHGKFYRTSIFWIYLGLIIIALPFIIEPATILINSILESDSSQEIRGSSTQMRQIQLEIVLSYLQQSPIWGNGRLYIWNHVEPDNPALYGAESMWFPLLVDYGIMGAISFLTLFVACFWELMKCNKYFVFFPLAYLTAKTISVTIGIEFYTLIIFSLLLIKIHAYYSPPNIPKKKYL